MNFNRINKVLQKNKKDFYLFTNNDLHLNESPNLYLKDIYNFLNFDCTRGYLLYFKKKLVFFTDSRYTVAAKNFFKSNCLVIDLNKISISKYLISLNKNLNGIIDSKLISVKEFKELNSQLEKHNINIYPSIENFLCKKYDPDFNISYPLSMPKYLIPRPFMENLKWIRQRISSDGLLIWNNSHVAYLLNVRSFELCNSTKPFAGLFISKKNNKPIIISNNYNLKNLTKIKKNFNLLNETKFLRFLKSSRLKQIESSYNDVNVDIYMRISSFLNISDTKINIPIFMSKKTSNEVKNIMFCHLEDGLAILKFIIDLKQKKIVPQNEYEISEYLYNYRKEGINFFRNSFDYISAFDSNAAIVHYKPLKNKSLSFKNRNILLLDSGGQYLEGTTDITRVIKVGNKNSLKIKYFYTYLLKSLIKIENKKFPKNIKAFEIDLFCRNYLSKFGIFYGHGTGHGVGNFGDVHEKFPIISPNSTHIIKNNNIFSIEPGHYLEGKFGLRIENLYVVKKQKNVTKLENISLAPYELDLIDWRLISKFEKNYIKSYHKKILRLFEKRIKQEYKDYFIENLINKI